MRRGQHQAPPGAGEQTGVDLGGADLLAAHQVRQRTQGPQDGQALRGGAEVDHRHQELQKRPHGAEPGDQLGPPCLVRVGVERRGQLEQCGDRGGQLVPRYHLLDPLPHRVQRLHLGRGDLPGVGVDLLGRGVEHDLEGGGQLRRRPLHPRQALQLLLRRLPLRAGQQLRRDEHFEQVQGVIDRAGRQVDRGRQQRRLAPGVAVPAQQRRLAVDAVPGQLRQPPRRYRGHVHLAHPEIGDLPRPLQRPLHLGARRSAPVPGAAGPAPTPGRPAAPSAGSPAPPADRCSAGRRGCPTATGSPPLARRRPAGPAWSRRHPVLHPG